MLSADPLVVPFAEQAALVTGLHDFVESLDQLHEFAELEAFFDESRGGPRAPDLATTIREDLVAALESSLGEAPMTSAELLATLAKRPELHGWNVRDLSTDGELRFGVEYEARLGGSAVDLGFQFGLTLGERAGGGEFFAVVDELTARPLGPAGIVTPVRPAAPVAVVESEEALVSAQLPATVALGAEMHAPVEVPIVQALDEPSPRASGPDELVAAESLDADVLVADTARDAVALGTSPDRAVVAPALAVFDVETSARGQGGPDVARESFDYALDDLIQLRAPLLEEVSPAAEPPGQESSVAEPQGVGPLPVGAGEREPVAEEAQTAFGQTGRERRVASFDEPLIVDPLTGM
jgi:hypothetical protein